MEKKMKALMAYAPYDYRYQDAPIPELSEGEVLIRVKGCGICAGDIKSFHGGIRIWGTNEENRYIEAPCIGGHEFCGEVVLTSPDVDGFVPGDLVVAEQIVPCNNCSFCREGEYWMCVRSAVFGFKQYCQGGFAEYVKIPKDCLKHKVPKGFSYEQAVLIEPIACGMHALELGRIRHSDVVVIAGLGAIGLSMVNMANLYLPRKIIGIDIKPFRVAKGREFGADVVLNPAECDVVREVMALTNGYGCDVYIEATGNPKSVSQGLKMLKNKGRYVQMGVFADEVTADWNVIGDGKELSIYGSHLSAKTYPSVIRGIQSGLIKTDNLISHVFKLEDCKEAFEAADKGPDVLKIMLVP